MPFEPGKSGNPSGRVKGTPNKATATVREAFTEAFNALKEDPEVGLAEWGRNNPTEFYKLCSKLIPLQITGEGGNPIEANITWLGINGKQSKQEADGSTGLLD